MVEKGYNNSFDGLTVSPTPIHSPVKKYITDDEVREDKRKMLQR